MVRFRPATPGTILCLAATALLAVVCFNTPLLKSLYFLHATFSSGEYSGDLFLGTLGYCLNDNGASSCVGPTIGYEFNPNQLFGISVFDIPQAITKYLTYTLVLHFIALGAAAGATVFGALSHISTMSVWCFPTCLASIASSFSLLALVFDLVIFYIAKARIDDVNGATASVGISVWLVLAAWLLAGIGGCAFGVGNCCYGKRRNSMSGDPKEAYYANQNRPDDFRLQAMRDEQIRKQEQGLPNFQELERTPLTSGPSDNEDKYLYEEQPMQASNGRLARDGSVLTGVGMGYGRRGPNEQGGLQQGTFGNGYGGYETLQPPSLARRVSSGSGVTAGNAGVGAGGQGVEGPEPQGYEQYYGDQQHNYYDGQNPYQQKPYEYGNNEYNANQSYDPYQQQQPNQQSYGSSSAFPQANPAVAAMPNAAPTGAGRYDSYSNQSSNDSHYRDPGQPVNHADPYGGYDDGLGAIGMAATSPTLDNGPHQPQSGYYNQNTGDGYYQDQRGGYPSQSNLHTPQPQRLAGSTSSSNLLRASASPPTEGGGFRVDSNGPSDYHTAPDGDHEEDMGNRPPSYGQIAGVANGQHDWQRENRNEKSGYR